MFKRSLGHSYNHLHYYKSTSVNGTYHGSLLPSSSSSTGVVLVRLLSSSKKPPLAEKYTMMYGRQQQSSSAAQGPGITSFAEKEFQKFLQGTSTLNTRNDFSVRTAPNAMSDVNESTGMYNSSQRDIVVYEQEIAKHFSRAKFLHLYGNTAEAINVIDSQVLPKIAQLVYFGTQHPIFADVLAIRGIYEIKLNRLAESFETLSIAVRIFGDTTTLRHRSAARALGSLGDVYMAIATSPANAPLRKQISKELLENITKEKGLALKEQAELINSDLDRLGGCGCCSCSAPTSHCAQLTCRWGKTFCLERTSCGSCPSPAEAAHQAVAFEKIDNKEQSDLLNLEATRDAAIKKLRADQAEAEIKEKIEYLEAEKNYKGGKSDNSFARVIKQASKLQQAKKQN